MDEITVESPQETPSERTMARLYFASFWAILFTGAVRKWLFPGVSIFYLLQDVPIGIAYVYALWKGLYVRGFLLIGILLISVLLALQGILQIIVSGLNTFVAFVGLHNYLFYLPMMVVFPICLIPKYRQRFIWWNLIASIPMCLLVIVQAESPKSAWVNRTSEGEAFGLPGVDVARVTGTFNFTVFYGIWVAIAVALCMGEWLLPKERRAIKKPWLLIVCTFAVNICHSGERLPFGDWTRGDVPSGRSGGSRGLGFIASHTGHRGNLHSAASRRGGDLRNLSCGVQHRHGSHSGREGQSRYRDPLGYGRDRMGNRAPQVSLIGAGIGMGVDASHIGNADTLQLHLRAL